MPSPKAFLIFRHGADRIAASDEIPHGFVKRTDEHIFSGIVAVWCEANASVSAFLAAAAHFARMSPYNELIRDVQTVVTHLELRFNKANTTYVTLGASPKLVKWLMKRRGFHVVTVNVSAIAASDQPTTEFLVYLRRKLAKYPARKITVMDFVDQGTSLRIIRRDILNIQPDAEVRLIAIGASPSVKEEKQTAGEIEIIRGIPALQAALNEQRLKHFVIGRHKQKNKYASWTKEIALETETIRLLGEGEVPMHRNFARQKQVLPLLLDQTPYGDFDVDDFLEEEEAGSDEFETGSGSHDE